MFNAEDVYFDSDYYASYKTLFKTICSFIDGLNQAIEYKHYSTLNYFALKLYNYTFVFEGYTDCLYDLRIINDVEYNAFYEFCKAIRIECNTFI